MEKFSKKDISSNEFIEIALDTEETFNLAIVFAVTYVLLMTKVLKIIRETKISTSEQG